MTTKERIAEIRRQMDGQLLIGHETIRLLADVAEAAEEFWQAMYNVNRNRALECPICEIDFDEPAPMHDDDCELRKMIAALAALGNDDAKD